MNAREATRLIAAAVTPQSGNWADVGAGEGTFTRALASLLEPGSRVFAIDRDARALEVLRRRSREAVRVLPVNADFTKSFEWRGLGEAALDVGVVLYEMATGTRPFPIWWATPWLRPPCTARRCRPASGTPRSLRSSTASSCAVSRRNRHAVHPQPTRCSRVSKP